MNIESVYTYKASSKSIVFHDYDVLLKGEVVHSLRADEREIEDVLHLFNLMAHYAKLNPRASFPLTVVEEDIIATIYGPCKKDQSWGQLMKGPKNTIKNLFTPLMNAFTSHQKNHIKSSLKI